MAKFRNDLPQLEDRLFLTDGGIETSLIFHEGCELPYFAAFDLLRTRQGRDTLYRYYKPYISLAKRNGLGFVLESPTWRASVDWAVKLGYSREALASVNREAIELMSALRSEFETSRTPLVISGCVGPRGDGYRPDSLMTADDAEAYHGEQIAVFADTEADIVTAITMTYADEAIGICRAAKARGMPVAISFTVETDGRLPTGETIRETIEAVDRATAGAPAYYMLNCAHPAHFEESLARGEAWLERLRGLRANASRRSHAELDEATDLDEGDPSDLARRYAELRNRLPSLNILGGCCGTDHRHVKAISDACLNAA